MKFPIAVLLSLLFTSQYIMAQGNEHGVPKIKTFKPQDYNGHAQTYDGIHASDGYLYFGNGSGILTYDGEDWNLVETSHITALLEASDGTIYASGPSEFGLLTKDESGAHIYKSLLSKLDSSKHNFDRANYIYESGDKIFVVARYGILTYDGDTVTRSHDENAYFFKSADVNQDRLITKNYRTQTVLTISEGKIDTLQKPALNAELVEAAIYKRFNGKWLMANRPRWFYVWEDSGESGPTGISKQLFQKEMWGIDSLGPDLAVVRTYRDGMYFLDAEGKFINKITMDDGLADNLVFHSFKDRQDNIWACTDVGISLIQNYGEVEYFQTRGSDGQSVETLARVQDKIYVGKGQSIQRLVEKNESWEFDEPIIAVFAVQIAEIGNETYAATERGFGKLIGNSIRLINEESARYFTQSKKDTSIFFFGNSEGAFWSQRSGDNWSEKTWIEGVNSHVRSIKEDDSGTLWLGTFNAGFYSVSNPTKDEVVRKFDLNDGLRSLSNSEVFEINGEILFGTQKGLFYFDETSDRFEPYCELGTYFCDSTTSVFRMTYNDHRNEMILMDYDYIYKVKFENGKSIVDSLTYQMFNEKGYNYAVVLDDDGVTWLAGPSGIVRFNPAAQTLTHGFLTKLQKVTFGTDSMVYITDGKDLTFREDVQDLRFEAAALFFESSNKNQYQYWLEGYDAKWSDWTYESFKDYTNLKGGDYTFHVRSKNTYGRLGSMASKSFNIEKDIFETLLFKFIILITITLLFYYASKYAITRRKLKALEIQQNLELAVAREREAGFKAVLNATEDERKRIAKDLHDGVVQQLAAIKVNLSVVEPVVRSEIEKVAILKALKIAEQAAIETRGLSHQMMPKALIELGLVPAMEDVISNMFAVNEIKADFQHFNLRGRYENQIEISVYRIFQELVNNISKHARAKSVDVQLIENDGNLILIVEDDGIGMDNEPTGGIGISNISSRLVTVDGKLDFSSGLNSGTIATVVIPL